MDTCEFSYISRQTGQMVQAKGIERSWSDLKIEFGRSGAQLMGARYFKTISDQGPQLFATLNEQLVFYHDNGQWYQYNTASNIRFSQVEDSQEKNEQAINEEKYSIEASGQ